jgi:replicative DNA helicase
MNLTELKHYSTELEQVIVGACLLESDAIARIRTLIAPDFFYTKARHVITTILQMWSESKPVDYVTVMLECEKAGLQDNFPNTVGQYLVQCSTSVVSSAHLEGWCLYLRQLAAERKLAELQSKAAVSGDVVERAWDIQRELDRIMGMKVTDDWHDMSEVIFSVEKHADKVRSLTYVGIPTGFSELDDITGGFSTGLIVIAARPSVGKTAFASTIAMNAASMGKKVGIISLEMPDEQVGGRLCALYTGIDFWRIFSGHIPDDQIRDYFQKLTTLANYPIFVSDQTSVTISDIRAKALKLKKKRGLEMLIIDFVQLIEGEGKASDNREREVARISRGCKLLSKELDIPVILLAQLNREIEKSKDKKPRLAMLRESGALEQDADLVLMLYRPIMSGIPIDSEGYSTQNQAFVLVEKNRNGKSPAEIELQYIPTLMKFANKGEVQVMPVRHGISAPSLDFDENPL